jgi:hypothetical protein
MTESLRAEEFLTGGTQIENNPQGLILAVSRALIVKAAKQSLLAFVD